MTPKDRHVLAAAVHSDCQLVVTFNLKDFPSSALRQHHLDAVNPDDFLLDQLDLYPGLVLASLQDQVADLRRPRLTALALLASLERSGTPRFAAEVRRKADISDGGILNAALAWVRPPVIHVAVLDGDWARAYRKGGSGSDAYWNAAGTVRQDRESALAEAVSQSFM